MDSVSVAWIDEEFGLFEKVPTPMVCRLELSRNYPWEGAAAGFLLVSVDLVWSGYWAPGQEGGNHPEASYLGRYITVAGGVAGAVLGAVAGSRITHRDEIQFAPPGGQSTTTSDSTNQ